MPRAHGNGAADPWQEMMHSGAASTFRLLRQAGLCVRRSAAKGFGADMRIAHPGPQLAVMTTNWGSCRRWRPVALAVSSAQRCAATAPKTATPSDTTPGQPSGWLTARFDTPIGAVISLALRIPGEEPKTMLADKAWINGAETLPKQEVPLADFGAQAAILGRPKSMHLMAATLVKRS
jgi:hypothetical protein